MREEAEWTGYGAEGRWGRKMYKVRPRSLAKGGSYLI